MRFFNNTSGRLAFYDRTPVCIANGTTLIGTAPHAQTTRVTLTAAASKIKQVFTLNLRMVVNTVATTPLLRQLKAIMTPNGGAATDIIAINLYGNTADLDRGGPITCLYIMAGNDSLSLTTSDASTGGTMDYMIGAQSTDFDL